MPDTIRAPRLTDAEKSAIQAEWLAEAERIELAKSPVDRREVVPGWTYDEIIQREA